MPESSPERPDKCTARQRQKALGLCSAKECVMSHALIANSPLSGFLSGDEKVHGESFNINDGGPHFFWGFDRSVWKFVLL
jgi:hypothetical protein